MLSKVQPCFQLLRIGSSSSPASAMPDSVRDLYTFRPTLTHSVFRLGRKPELCDVTLQSTSISRIHAELLAEREGDGEGEEEEGWRVHIKDRSSYGTWVNELRLQPGVQWELSDGDTLTFGGQSDCGSPEFYFLFQKVLVRPSEFDAITVPKAGFFCSDLQNRIRTSLEPKMEPNVDISSLSLNRATVILNSIGSISKMNGSCWTFKRTDDIAHSNSASQASPSLGSPSTPPSNPPVSFVSSSKSVPPSSKSRRKSAHTVLLEDDSSDETRKNGGTGEARRKNGSKRRRLCKSECEVFHPPLSKGEQWPANEQFDQSEQSQNGYQLSSQSKGKLSHVFSISGKRQEFNLNLKVGSGINASAYVPQTVFACSTSSRGSRRANSTPVCPVSVAGQSYTLVSPSLRLCELDGAGRGDFAGAHVSNGKRRGRPRKHPLGPPQSPLSPFRSSSCAAEGERARAEEPCAARRCLMPQQETVQWIQCDDCDSWYHIDCIQSDTHTFMLDTSADFHCGCR